MRLARTCFLLLTCAVLSAKGARAEQPVLRASLGDTDPVWVGQQVTMIVELLVPGYFSSAASFDIPDPDGVLLMPPAGHPLVTSETLDGERYSVQRHRLAAWPMRPGAQSIPALTVRFRYKHRPLDNADVPAALTTEPLAFEVAVPPGAEALGIVISARDLRLEESWDPVPGADEVRAGDAFVRTVTFSAPEVPGMVFPPFPATRMDGLGVYAQPTLLDRNNRGALTGVRRDRITYTFERAGRFVIPASRFTWFDLDTRELRTERLPARTFDVAANPALTSARAPAPDRRPHAPPWTAITAILAGGALLCAAWRSRTLRRLGSACAERLRPLHLQPLNPTAPRRRS